MTSIATIQATVAYELAIPLSEMTSHRRPKRVAHARQVAMVLACRLTRHSISAVGRMFGDRDHTTVLHAKRAVAERCAKDSALARRIAQLEQQLRPAPAVAADQPAECQLALFIGPLFDRAGLTGLSA